VPGGHPGLVRAPEREELVLDGGLAAGRPVAIVAARDAKETGGAAHQCGTTGPLEERTPVDRRVRAHESPRAPAIVERFSDSSASVACMAVLSSSVSSSYDR